MARQRRSLAEMDAEAIANAPDLEPAPKPKLEPKPQQKAMDVGESPTAAAPAKEVAGVTSRIGTYLTDSEVAEARAAFVADWEDGGELDNFGAWIASAIEVHARRSPSEREDAAPATPVRSDVKTGRSRGYLVPESVIVRMREAIIADRKDGRVTSQSRWAREAIVVATDHSRARSGGQLQPVSGRLPGKMIR